MSTAEEWDVGDLAVTSESVTVSSATSLISEALYEAVLAYEAVSAGEEEVQASLSCGYCYYYYSVIVATGYATICDVVYLSVTSVVAGIITYLWE